MKSFAKWNVKPANSTISTDWTQLPPSVGNPFSLPSSFLLPAQRKRKCVAVQDFKIEFRVAFCVILKNRPQNHFKATWKWHFELILPHSPLGTVRLTVCAFPFPFAICLISLPPPFATLCALGALATNLLIYSLRKGCLIRFDDVFIYLLSKKNLWNSMRLSLSPSLFLSLTFPRETREKYFSTYR